MKRLHAFRQENGSHRFLHNNKLEQFTDSIFFEAELSEGGRSNSGHLFSGALFLLNVFVLLYFRNPFLNAFVYIFQDFERSKAFSFLSEIKKR